MKTYNFKEHHKGDTFKSPTFRLTINGVIQDIAEYEIRMQIRKDAAKTSPVMAEFNTKDETIERLTPTTDGEFKLKNRILDIPRGIYKYDVEFIKDEVVSTWMKGIVPITEEVTQ